MKTPVTALAALLALPLAACDRAAFVVSRDLLHHDAVLVDADARSIRVEPDDRPAYDIPRTDIVSIDHPGNVALGGGVAVSALGGGMFALGAVAATGGGGEPLVTGLVMLGLGAAGMAVGIPLAIDGHERWRTSTGVVQQRTRISVEAMPTGVRVRF